MSDNDSKEYNYELEDDNKEEPSEGSEESFAAGEESVEPDAEAPAPEYGTEAPVPGYGAEMPTTKPCVFCGSEIGVAASRCPHCAGFLPIAEGTIFKQHFFFLFSALAIAIGCLLPWERSYGVMNLTGIDSIAGGFTFVFAVYAVIASWWNIYHRKMIVWPILLAAFDGAVFGWARVVQIAMEVVPPTNLEGFAKIQTTVKLYIGSFGPGLYLVTFFSTLVILSIFVSVFKGAKQDSARKSAEREMRVEARKTRRS